MEFGVSHVENSDVTTEKDVEGQKYQELPTSEKQNTTKRKKDNGDSKETLLRNEIIPTEGTNGKGTTDKKSTEVLSRQHLSVSNETAPPPETTL